MSAPLAVRDYMTADVETVDPEATVRAAAERLHAATVGSLVVVSDGVPTGILTEADLTRLLATGGDPDAITVREVMTDAPVTVDPDATLATAAELFVDGGFRRLPVVADGELVGILTTTDLAAAVPGLQGLDAVERLAGRDDTAYETADWEFESEGTESLGVGDRVRFSKTLSEADVREFAHASGDTNRLHLDAEFAAGTRFGRPIVHGTLAGGVISAALARLPGLTVYLSQDLRYLGPVDPDERVTAVCEVVEDLGNARYRLATTVYGDDDEPVIDGEATVLVDELPGGEAGAKD